MAEEEKSSENFKTLEKARKSIGAAFNYVKGTIKKHENSSVYKLLNNNIEKLSNILKTLNAMLEARGVGAKQLNEKIDDAKKFGKSLLAETKERGGVLNTVKAKAAGLKSKLSGMFKLQNETGTSPPAEQEQKSWLARTKEMLSDKIVGEKKSITYTASFDPEDNTLINITNDFNSDKFIATAEQYRKWKFMQKLIPFTTLVENFDTEVEEEQDDAIKKAIKRHEKKLNKKSKSRTEKEKQETESQNEEAEKKEEKKESFFTKMFSKSKERAEGRKKEVEEEKKAVQDKMKEKAKGGGWLGKILKGLMSLGGFLLTGIKSAVGFLGGFVVKGLSSILFKLVPMLSGGIAKTVQALASGGLRAAGSLAWAGIKGAATALAPSLGTAAAAVGRGALMLATGPVGWAVAIGTAAYAGYKLYKYLKRNDVADDLPGKLTRLRLLTYGFDDTNKEYYSKIFDLEMMMKEKVKYVNYKVKIDKLDKETIEKILDIFYVKKDEKEKYNRLNIWFMKRFIPAFRAHIEAIYGVNNAIYVDEIDKFKPVDLFNVITKLNIPTSIYDITEVPTLQDFKTNVTKQQVDDLLANIMFEARKDGAEKGASQKEMSKVKAQNDANKAKAANQQQQAKPQEVTKSAVPPASISADTSKMMGGGEGEPKPKEEVATGNSVTGNMEAKVSGKLNKASGELLPGSASLEGITTKLPKEKIFNLDPNVRELFTGMAKEYNSLTGKTINVNEAFRSYEDQAALYRAYPGKAAKPGGSTHEAGLAVDINSADANELEKLGLLRKYGFTRPIGGEKWHLEPAGVAINPTAARKDETYRYKAILASPGRGGDGYGIQDNSVMKKRNVEYQLAVYNKEASNPIDIEKTLNKGKDTLTKEPIIDKPKGDNTTKPSTPMSQKDVKTASAEPMVETKPPVNTPSIKKDVSLDQGPKPAVQNNGNTDIGKFADLGPDEAIKQAAKMTGMNEEVMKAYAQMESSGKGGSIKNKNSSATGLFQIVGDTWKELVAKYGPKYNLPPDAQPSNNFYNALMAMEYAKQNLAGLGDYKAAGIDEATAIYLAHHYGPSGSKKIIEFLKKDPNSPMEKAVSPDAFAANKAAIGNNTVSGYVQKVSGKIVTAMNADGTKNQGGLQKAVLTSSTPETKQSPSTTPQKAIYSPEQSAYKTVSTAPKPSAPSMPQPQQQPATMASSKVENILSDQLNTLTQIASILTSIDGKFDIDKLKGMAGGQQQAPQQPIDKSIPKGSVNLSRKKIET